MNELAEPCLVSGERRLAPRAAVMLEATLERGGLSSIVRVVNLSDKGSSITGDLPVKHCSVTLRRKGIAVRGRIAWASNGRGGVAFNETIDPREMLRAIPRPRAVHHAAEGRPPVAGCRLSRVEQQKMYRCASLLGILVTSERF